MLFDAIRNLSMFVKLYIKCLHTGVKGLRWPNTNHVRRGFLFPQQGRYVDNVIFSQLTAHRFVRQLLVKESIKREMVILASVNAGGIHVNLYRLVKDKGQTDLKIPVNGLPGTNGQFYYLMLNGRLFHSRQHTSMTRSKGFFECDPIASLLITPTENTKYELLDFLARDVEHQDNLQRTEVEIDGKPCHVYRCDGKDVMTITYG